MYFFSDHEENVTKNQYCFIKSSFNWKNAKVLCILFKLIIYILSLAGH